MSLPSPLPGDSQRCPVSSRWWEPGACLSWGWQGLTLRPQWPLPQGGRSTPVLVLVWPCVSSMCRWAEPEGRWGPLALLQAQAAARHWVEEPLCLELGALACPPSASGTPALQEELWTERTVRGVTKRAEEGEAAPGPAHGPLLAQERAPTP